MAMFDTRGIGAGTLIKSTFKEFSEDDMSIYAAALSFHGLLSLFPFVLFLVALIGFLDLQQFFDWMREQAALLLPANAMQQIDTVIEEVRSSQGGLLSVGALLALISASKGVRTLMHALNVAYDVEEERSGWKLFLLSLVNTIGLAVMLLAAAALMLMGPQIVEWLAGQIGLRELFVTLWTWLRWPVAIVLLMLAVAVIYYVAPDVEQRFRFITPGSVIAVLVWILASLAFGFYVQNFGDYNATYGSIGAIIVLLLYFYISALVLLLGAELNAVIEHASVEGKNKGEKEVD